MTAAKPAKHGTGHFIAERVTSIALLLLLPWFLFSVAISVNGDFDSAFRWVAHPVNAGGLLLFLVISIYHMRLGVQVVIEDYISAASSRGLLLAVNTLICLAAALAGAWAIYQISFGG
jgi:succinate dehydrogenase / fumarate reductase, membrane anchor subunit